MRRHRRFERFGQLYDLDTFHEVVKADHLVAARLDPAYALRLDSEGVLDLTFCAGERFAVVPFIVIQSVALLLHERSPFIWPAWLPSLRADVVQEIEEYLGPWMTSLVLARFANEETTRLFGNHQDAHALFERARERGFLGAAPSERVMRAASPYVYAMRFAAGRRIYARDPDAASGVAMLARIAASIDVDFEDAQGEEDAKRWFGAQCFPQARGGAFDIAVGSRGGTRAPITVTLDEAALEGERAVEVATPIPIGVMASFDPGDGAPCRSFAVAAPAVSVRPSGVARARVVGGSAGRIAVVVRGDYTGNDDADVDEARALATRLNEQGFTASVLPGTHVRTREFDLLHVYGRRAATDMLETLRKQPGPTPPIVATLYLDDPVREAVWGAHVHGSAITNAPDDTLREIYFEALERRMIELAGAPVRGAASEADAAIVELLKRTGAVVASCEPEERVLRERFGFTGPVRYSAAMLADEPEPADTASLAGIDDFVFVHAPMEPRCGQYAIVRAASDLGMPVVLCGPVQDVGYYGDVMQTMPAQGIWIGSDQIGPAELAGLYRRARVFVDVSWSAGGLGRVARAAASGAAIVVPSSGYGRYLWAGCAQIADPASFDAIRTALRVAWDRAGELGPAAAARTAEIGNPFNSLVAVLAAYQLAAEPISSQT